MAIFNEYLEQKYFFFTVLPTKWTNRKIQNDSWHWKLWWDTFLNLFHLRNIFRPRNKTKNDTLGLCLIIFDIVNVEEQIFLLDIYLSSQKVRRTFNTFITSFISMIVNIQYYFLDTLYISIILGDTHIITLRKIKLLFVNINLCLFGHLLRWNLKS